MNKFIQCFDEKEKEKLINNGFKFINMFKTNIGYCYVFENNQDINKLNFDVSRLVFTNRLMF